MEQRRFVGIDLGKRTYEIKIIGSNGRVTGTNGLTSPKGRKELYKRLLSTDRIAIEVCSLSMVMAKEIHKEVGCEVMLLNPSQIALIYRSVKKNDKEDALKLARLVQKFIDEELPKVELPSEHEENIRHILTEFRQLRHDRTEEIEKLLDREIDGDKNIERLTEIPGVGKQLASAYAAFIGDGSRYSNVSAIGAATGLVPRLDMSSTVCRLGHITKCGNRHLRSLLILAAWSHIRYSGESALKEKYLYMTKVLSKGKKIAIVATARKLAELMYTILKNDTPYEKRISPAFSTRKLADEALA